MIHSQESIKRVAANLDYPHYYELILSEKSGSPSYVLPLRQKKKLSLGEFNFIALFLNWKIEPPCKSSKWESKCFLWVDNAAIFFIAIREDLRRHLCFCWNWKSLKVLVVLAHLAVSILGQDLLWVDIWELGQPQPLLWTTKVFIWNNSLNLFPRFRFTKQKPIHCYSCMSLFISTILLPQGHFWATAEGKAWFNKNLSLNF